MSKKRIQAYIEKLCQLAQKIEYKLQNEEPGDKGVRKMTGGDFEKMVYDSLLEAGFKESEIAHHPQKFPDFVLEDSTDGEKIGVEVKKTDSAKWEVIGGSVYESLKNEIEDTYVLMAKLGGSRPEVRLKRYEECIADMKVTHNPRFYLNLDLEKGDDYLTRNNAQDLLMLSGDDLNRKIRQLLRTQKSTWWSGDRATAFSDLPIEEKGIYLNDGIALFPEVFGGDYSKFTPWLVYICFVWCGNVRDIFSAGGNRLLEDIPLYVSAIMYRTLQNLESIRQRITDMTEDEQNTFWGGSSNDISERLNRWMELVGKNLKISRELISNNRRLSVYEALDDEQIVAKVKETFMSRLKKGLMNLC